MTKINGFILIKEQHVEEVNGVVSLWKHEKTDASLTIVKNDDKEKAFNIAFTTLPKTDNGVPHILEHSVLCGSEKYPTKEPFVELMKGSFNSFLNASTYNDKTLYPLASTNDKDFLNQAGVYLDAVFFPLLKKDPRVLMQEGWHYEFDENENLIYNGVVYNEMKGAFSNPSRALYMSAQRALFNNVYSVESGGDPDVIPTLTQEEFCAFHTKHYHPSNSSTCFYGDVDVEKCTALLDSYFSRFEKSTRYCVELQQPTSQLQRVDADFEISENENPEEKAKMLLTFVGCESTDIKTLRGTDILTEILSSEASPLKLALRKANVGSNISIGYDIAARQSMIFVEIDGANENRADEFEQIVFDTLKDVVKNGLDNKLVKSSINNYKFHLKESANGGMSKGIMTTHYVLFADLYNGDVFDSISYNKVINEIDQDSENGYFEKLIEEYLLNNTHVARVVLHPKKGLGKIRDEKFLAQMKQIKDSLSQEQINEILSNVEKLRQRQQTPDSEEALATIPHLSLSEIDKHQDFEAIQVTNNNTLWHEVFSDGIAYVKLQFGIDALSTEELPYLGILGGLLSNLDTEKRSFLDLSNEMGICLGRFHGSAVVYTTPNGIKPFYEINTSILTENVEKGLELVNEIITQTVFADKERIKQLLTADLNNSMMMGMNAGHVMALNRVYSYFSQGGVISDLTSGIGHLDFLKELCAEFNFEKIQATLESICKKIFTKDNFTVCVTGSQNEKDAVEQHVSKLNLFEKQQPTLEIPQPQAKNEGFGCPSLVQYVATGANYRDLGFNDSGALAVASNILRSGYLWNTLRVQGGAYGAMLLSRPNGMMVFVSYRDPKLAESYKAYENACEFLANFESTPDELTKSIIGTISDFDAPIPPRTKGETAVSNYYSQRTQEQLQQKRDQVLACSVEDVRKISNLVKAVVDQHNIVTIGNAEKVEQNKDLFKTTRSLF